MQEVVSIKRKTINPNKKPLAIILGMVGGFNAMFIAFLFDFGTTVAMLGLLLPMLVVIPLFVQLALVTVDERGVTQQLTPFFRYWSLYKKTDTKFYSWENVRSYKNEERWHRYKGNKQYIQLSMFDGYKIYVNESDVAHTDEFNKFRDTVLRYINADSNERLSKAKLSNRNFQTPQVV